MDHFWVRKTAHRHTVPGISKLTVERTLNIKPMGGKYKKLLQDCRKQKSLLIV